MSSVGIIGGSDGPTSIIVSQKFNAVPIIIGACAIIAIIVAIVIFAKKNNNNKNSEDK